MCGKKHLEAKSLILRSLRVLSKLAVQPGRLLLSIGFALKNKQFWKAGTSFLSIAAGSAAVILFVFFTGNPLTLTGTAAASAWGTIIGLFTFASLTMDLLIAFGRSLREREGISTALKYLTLPIILASISITFTAVFWSALPFTAPEAIALNIASLFVPLVCVFLIKQHFVAKAPIPEGSTNTKSLFAQVMASLFSWMSDPLVATPNRFSQDSGAPAAAQAQQPTMPSAPPRSPSTSDTPTEALSQTSTTEVRDNGNASSESLYPAASKGSFFDRPAPTIAQMSDPGNSLSW